MDLVSIIIPTYKGKDSICKALDSALNQDYPNIEIIVVDDNGKGSTEQKDTEKIIRQYSKKNDNIRYIKHEYNMNGSAARNTGIRFAKGKYIALLDDDDVFHKHKIRLQMEALANRPSEYAVCYTSYQNIFEDGRTRKVIAEKEGSLCFDLLAMKISVLSSVLLFRKDAWEEIGGFDETFKRDQDQEFCVRLFNKYKAVAVEEICMTRYVLKRNIPKTVDVGVKYREYYLTRMEPIINQFDENQKKEIFSANYTAIAKRYLRRKMFFKALEYIIKSRTPIKSIIKLANDFVRYRKSKKSIN